MATLTAYLSQYGCDANKLDGMTQDQLAIDLVLSPGNLTSAGYTPVGAAEVQITLHTSEARTANAVAVLRAEQVKLRAEATAADTRLEGQIQRLLSITNEVSA